MSTTPNQRPLRIRPENWRARQPVFIGGPVTIPRQWFGCAAAVKAALRREGPVANFRAAAGDARARWAWAYQCARIIAPETGPRPRHMMVSAAAGILGWACV